MIVAVELASNEWEHEESNQGMLKLISECSRDKIYFAASHDHIEVIKKLGIPEKVLCHEIEVLKRQCAWDWTYKDIYVRMFAGILENFQLSKSDKVFVLTTTKTLMAAAVEANRTYGVDLFFLEHANLEDALKEKNENAENTEVNVINQTAELENTHFLAYSPYIKSKMKGILTPKAINKFHFIYCPISDDVVEPNTKKDCLTIGVYGACFNNTFRELLKMMYDRKGMERQNFLVLRRCNINNMDYRYLFPSKGIEMHQSLGGFTRKEILNYVKQMDWILLPYPPNLYQVSVSGILVEALGFEKPILALSNSIVNWYNQQPIGIVRDSMEELCDVILQQSELCNQEKYRQYQKNMNLIKVKGRQENKAVMKRLLEEA